MKRYPGVAVVTGASSGMGRAFAKALAADGVEVVLVARRGDLLEELAKEIGARALPADLSTVAGCEAVAQALEGEEVGMLVHSAGFATLGHFDLLDIETQRKMVAVNASALMELTHRFLPGMLERKSGAIIVVSSISAFLPSPYLGAYGGTKAFVQSFIEGLHREVAPRGIDVLASCPGPTRTEFQATANIDMDGPGMMSPEYVAATTLKALGRRPLVVVGPQHKLVTFLTRFVPRGLVTWSGRRVLLRLSKRLQDQQRRLS